MLQTITIRKHPIQNQNKMIPKMDFFIFCQVLKRMRDRKMSTNFDNFSRHNSQLSSLLLFRNKEKMSFFRLPYNLLQNSAQFNDHTI